MSIRTATVWALSLVMLLVADVSTSEADDLRVRAARLRHEAAERARRGDHGKHEWLGRETEELTISAEIERASRELDYLRGAERELLQSFSNEHPKLQEHRRKIEFAERRLRELHERRRRAAGPHDRAGHMRAAAGHLEAAGMHELADELRRQAGRAEGAEHGRDEAARQIEELRRSIERLRAEVAALRANLEGRGR